MKKHPLQILQKIISVFLVFAMVLTCENPSPLSAAAASNAAASALTPKETKPSFTAIKWRGGSAYSQTLTAEKNTPISWNISRGNLPVGMFRSFSGTLVGASQKSGDYAFTVQATNPAVSDYTPSGNADLSDLKVNGQTISDFHKDQTNYDVELPFGTVAATVEATPEDSNASVNISQAESLPGDATVTVTAEDKSTKIYTVYFSLRDEPFVPVKKITVRSTADSIPVGGSLQMTADVSPVNASDKSIEWSVEQNSGKATVNSDGLLTATAAGIVTVYADAMDDSGIYGEKEITILPAGKASHGITVQSGGHGTADANSASAVAGTVITLTAVPDSGYRFKGWQVVSGGASPSSMSSAVTTFLMPDQPVTVRAVFESKNTDDNSGPSSGSVTATPPVLTDPVTGIAAGLSSSVSGAVLSVTRPDTAGPSADPQGAAACLAAVSSTSLSIIGTPLLYNICLLDQNGNPLYLTGSVTVTIPIPSGILGSPRVFRYEWDGTLTDMDAKLENGYLLFSTTHFSYYLVAGTGNSLTLDTKSYEMPVGGKYQIGVKLTGNQKAIVKVHSTNDKAADAARLANGNVLINGKGVGTAWIMFDVYDDKGGLLAHLSTFVDVKTGIRPRGDSTRQTITYTLS